MMYLSFSALISWVFTGSTFLCWRFEDARGKNRKTLPRRRVFSRAALACQSPPAYRRRRPMHDRMHYHPRMQSFNGDQAALPPPDFFLPEGSDFPLSFVFVGPPSLVALSLFAARSSAALPLLRLFL